jgi:hypothetical protein
MSLLVFASPYTPPPPPVSPVAGLAMTWTGADGRAWNLNDPDGGVCLLLEAVEGMHLPEFADYVQEFDGIDGQEYSGGVARARQVEWPIFVFSDASSAEWLAIEQAWWGSFKPRGSVGVWTVTGPSGESRHLNCRLTSDGGYAHSMDPSAVGWAQYPVTLVADDPWWHGGPIQGGPWTPAAPVLFFGGGDPATGVQLAPPFGITPSNTFANATMFNPGDEPTYLEWTLNGPITAATITVDGGSIGIPAITAGQTLVVNTSPDNPTAFLNGTEVSGLINPWDPRPLPPQTDVAVDLAVTFGTGASITATAPTNYWRAFG